MRIESAQYKNGQLILAAPTEARRFAYNFKPGDYEIVKSKQRRSLDANAYAWVLIDKISSIVRLPPLEVYRNAVRDMGGTSEMICVRADAADKLERIWTSGHIGRQVQREPSWIANSVNLRLIYGSSDYDVREMSRFIDNLVQDCRALGIETRPEEEIKSLLEAWGHA